MDFVNYVLNYVSRVIPREVLDLSVTTPRLSRSASSLETRVENELLRPSFFLDMNMITGVEIVVPISNLEYNSEVDGVTLLRVPDSYLQGRRIITALSLAEYNDVNKGHPSNALEGFGATMERNHSWTTSVVTSQLEVISPNEVLVYADFTAIFNLVLRLNVELSNNFREINTKSYPALAEIAVLAAKMMIYTKTSVALGKGQLYHGHDLGAIRDIIDGYSDAYQSYYERLPLMKKTIFMNDAVSMERYIQSMIPNNI